jgi:hypothetical protein
MLVDIIAAQIALPSAVQWSALAGPTGCRETLVGQPGTYGRVGRVESEATTPASRFPCRPPVLDFLHSLTTPPRSLERVTGLGSIPGLPKFQVHVHLPGRPLGFGWHRHSYWQPLLELDLSDSLIFADPDNGFETETQAGPQHLRFTEAAMILNALPWTSALVVFQYRSQGQSWDTVFSRCTRGLPPELGFVAIHHGQLAFVFLAVFPVITIIESSVETYAISHGDLEIRRRHAEQDNPADRKGGG